MIVMQDKLQEIIDELKVTNAETFYHSIHVKSYVYKMLKCMNASGDTSYSQQEIEFICKGAILHDIGKLYVKNYILTKDSFLTDEEKERFEIIEKTYLNALKKGDKNVYLIDGKALMKEAENDGTVDGCHPNDLGFYSMAKAVGDVA